MLTKGEKALYRDDELVKATVNADGYRWWKNGVLSFDDEPIANVIDMLSDYYGKKIKMEFKEHADYRCSAKFYYNDGLDYILRIIQREVHYQIINDPAEDMIILR